MKRKSCALAMLAVMLAGSTLTAHAEHHVVDRAEGGEPWKVQFTGKKMDSNFDSRDIIGAISAIEPGDDIEIRITLENTDSRKATWYLQNEVIQSLEKGKSEASGGAYTYNLTYTPQDSTKDTLVLYDSENVGGEKSGSRGEGLEEIMSDLKEDDWLYMDQLKSKEAGVVSLKVGLDGETQGNGYQNTLAKLQLNFAVERAAASTSGSGGNGSSHRTYPEAEGISAAPAAPESVVYSPGAVQTGDPDSMLMWSAAALASGIVLLIFAIMFYRRRREVKP